MRGKVNFAKLFFLSIVLSSCNRIDNQITISIKVIDFDTKSPRINDTVKIRQAKFGIPMRRYTKIGEYTTDSLGIVTVNLFKNERYSFTTYGTKYANGSTEFAEGELKDGELVIIEVISPQKDSTLLVPSQKHPRRQNW